MTCINTIRDSGCYLASVIDLHTKKIVGYASDKKMTTDLIIRALDYAVLVQKPDEGLIFHSDLGSQYTSSDSSNYDQ
ncbi:DDE-type integrase/transposase/recombinase [Terrisporobacter petrolearius]|uniref:DDE-type integrase/transposase/recombinase n=1 Tax=Terrisporobacter petrolearius TaxID=1460447 RepID=UPI003A7F2C74